MSRPPIDFCVVKAAFDANPEVIKIPKLSIKHLLNLRVVDNEAFCETFCPETIVIGPATEVTDSKGSTKFRRTIKIHRDTVSLEKTVLLSFSDNKELTDFYKKYKNKNHTDDSLYQFEAFIYEKVLRSSASSIVKMQDKNGNFYYAVKHKKIAKGGFASVKEASVYNIYGSLLPKKYAIRSASERRPVCVAEKNCDHSIAQSTRDNKLNSPETTHRSYTLHEQGFCNLKDYIEQLKRTGAFSFCENEKIMWEIVTRVTLLAYRCYQERIAHRDIKPDNFLLLMQHKLFMQLIDWDFALDKLNHLPHDSCGTEGYYQPGLLPLKQDLYALSKTLKEILPEDFFIFKGSEPLIWMLHKNLDSHRTPQFDVRELLCAMLLAQNDLLQFSADKKTVALKKELVDLILLYEDQFSQWSWLRNEPVRQKIRNVVAQKNSTVQDLKALLDALVSEGNILLKQPKTKAEFIVPADLPKPRESAAVWISSNPYAILHLNYTRNLPKKPIEPHASSSSSASNETRCAVS